MRRFAQCIFLMLVISIIAGQMVYGARKSRVAAADPAFRVSGIYSHFEYYEESGDLCGMELFIFPDRNGDDDYSVLVQDAGGEIGRAVLLPLKVKGNRIEFTIPLVPGLPKGSKPEHYVGVIKGNRLLLTDHAGNKFSLPRGKSYWQ